MIGVRIIPKFYQSRFSKLKKCDTHLVAHLLAHDPDYVKDIVWAEFVAARRSER